MSRVKDAQTSRSTRLKQENSLDLISNLPANLTDKILGSLPLQDAVKTSILSSQWRYKWTSLLQIKLDEHLFDSVVKGKVKRKDITNTYSNIVNHVLHCHVGPLLKLVLYLPHYFKNGENVIQWLRSVSGKGGLTELTLIDHRSTEKLPLTIFSYTGLTHLVLDRCELPTLPRSFAGFPSLESVRLNLCKFNSSDDIERFIRGCPQLRHLYSHEVMIFNQTLDGLKLDQLFLCGSLPKIESLSFGSSSLTKCKDWCFRNKGLIDVIGRLQSLELIDIPLNCPITIESALIVLRSSLNLQRLYCKVSNWNYCRCETHGVPTTSSNLSRTDQGNLPCLKYAELECVSGSNFELEFIKVILECAPLLEVMIIELKKRIRKPEQKLSIATRLMNFSRASRNAKIVFKAT